MCLLIYWPKICFLTSNGSTEAPQIMQSGRQVNWHLKPTIPADTHHFLGATFLSFHAYQDPVWKKDQLLTWEHNTVSTPSDTPRLAHEKYPSYIPLSYQSLNVHFLLLPPSLLSPTPPHITIYILVCKYVQLCADSYTLCYHMPNVCIHPQGQQSHFGRVRTNDPRTCHLAKIQRLHCVLI